MRKFLITLATLIFVGTASAATPLRSCTKICGDQKTNCTKTNSAVKCANIYNLCTSQCSQTFNINRAIIAMIDEQELNDSLKATFDGADTDKDGFLTSTELIPVQGQNEDRVLKYIKNYDVNGDNKLDLSEFKGSHEEYRDTVDYKNDLAQQAAADAKAAADAAAVQAAADKAAADAQAAADAKAVADAQAAADAKAIADAKAAADTQAAVDAQAAADAKAIADAKAAADTQAAVDAKAAADAQAATDAAAAQAAADKAAADAQAAADAAAAQAATDKAAADAQAAADAAKAAADAAAQAGTGTTDSTPVQTPTTDSTTTTPTTDSSAPADSTTTDSGAAPQSLLVQPQITWNCTYRCSVYNTCMVKGAWNGDTSKCGAEPSGCQCVWGSL